MSNLQIIEFTNSSHVARPDTIQARITPYSGTITIHENGQIVTIELPLLMSIPTRANALKKITTIMDFFQKISDYLEKLPPAVEISTTKKRNLKSHESEN